MANSAGAGSGLFAALSRELEATVDRADPWIVSIDARAGLPTSGVIWSRGVVVATHHTLVREEGLTVRFSDGSERQAEIAGRDPGTDLAVLTVETEDRPIAPADPEVAVRTGQLVLSVGRNSEHGLRTSLGTIGGVGAEWLTHRGGRIEQYILLDLSTYPGFSGGPLLDAEGRVIGVNTAGLSRQSGVAIPIATVNRVAKELTERGRVRRGYLGVGLYSVRVSESMRTRLSIPNERGIMIVGLEEGGAAERSGVILGDLIISIDGAPVQDPEELQTRLGEESVGRKLAASVVRGGARVEISIEVGERPGRPR